MRNLLVAWGPEGRFFSLSYTLDLAGLERGLGINIF